MENTSKSAVMEGRASSSAGCRCVTGFVRKTGKSTRVESRLAETKDVDGERGVRDSLRSLRGSVGRQTQTVYPIQDQGTYFSC